MLKLNSTSISLAIAVEPADARSRVPAGPIPQVMDETGFSNLSDTLHTGKTS